MGLYDRYLAARVRLSNEDAPNHIALVITERDLLEPNAYGTLTSFLRWAFDTGTETVTIYVSVLDAEAIPTLRQTLSELESPREVAIRGPEADAPADAPVQVSIGLGGREEFAAAVRQIAEDAAAGALAPDDIDESEIERRLVFRNQPDLVIKTGAERLSDFLIWQSVYSELYFTDVNWRAFRRRDFLRAVREFQERQRRFGR
ncbi:tritrans,polycis-undecaprenyl-diphosphate synthase (geranylgeranyl-diphosphate specific) [Natronomonas pharaonis DSM 2160]|uniref:Tritrans,polycis-undecaprenyl-diphosphate synthase (Geranylgeranyl-diphosphate specific) n=1 Tax=Natronomonas pharaonis (strain ATCC 35678 / DSM 2160 / CIP 103997 / JCM 8858 / NBRC 14720 / NCIMB 2260 / Gabara) TaxID=348780 RepID=A0A1U7EYP0_NATPD|nr:undecaprenyl diphosphate synthase family protein [Natronomonas pharaonis]CAI50363.1 tritrans,polycis-undecaprenyl-diphosphate synthase (geranylgeranyl-diphosphate specific) [Natronomonas pharaonis DSM 2160]